MKLNSTGVGAGRRVATTASAEGTRENPNATSSVMAEAVNPTAARRAEADSRVVVPAAARARCNSLPTRPLRRLMGGLNAPRTSLREAAIRRRTRSMPPPQADAAPQHHLDAVWETVERQHGYESGLGALNLAALMDRPEMRQQDRSGQTIFHRAVATGRADILADLLRLAHSPTWEVLKHQVAWSLLATAIDGENYAAIKTIVDHFAADTGLLKQWSGIIATRYPAVAHEVADNELLRETGLASPAAVFAQAWAHHLLLTQGPQSLVILDPIAQMEAMAMRPKRDLIAAFADLRTTLETFCKSMDNGQDSSVEPLLAAAGVYNAIQNNLSSTMLSLMHKRDLAKLIEEASQNALFRIGYHFDILAGTCPEPLVERQQVEAQRDFLVLQMQRLARLFWNLKGPNAAYSYADLAPTAALAPASSERPAGFFRAIAQGRPNDVQATRVADEKYWYIHEAQTQPACELMRQAVLDKCEHLLQRNGPGLGRHWIVMLREAATDCAPIFKDIDTYLQLCEQNRLALAQDQLVASDAAILVSMLQPLADVLVPKLSAAASTVAESSWKRTTKRVVQQQLLEQWVYPLKQRAKASANLFTATRLDNGAAQRLLMKVLELEEQIQASILQCLAPPTATDPGKQATDWQHFVAVCGEGDAPTSERHGKQRRWRSGSDALPASGVASGEFDAAGEADETANDVGIDEFEMTYRYLAMGGGEQASRFERRTWIYGRDATFLAGLDPVAQQQLLANYEHHTQELLDDARAASQTALWSLLSIVRSVVDHCAQLRSGQGDFRTAAAHMGDLMDVFDKEAQIFAGNVKLARASSERFWQFTQARAQGAVALSSGQSTPPSFEAQLRKIAAEFLRDYNVLVARLAATAEGLKTQTQEHIQDTMGCLRGLSRQASQRRYAAALRTGADEPSRGATSNMRVAQAGLDRLQNRVVAVADTYRRGLPHRVA